MEQKFFPAVIVQARAFLAVLGISFFCAGAAWGQSGWEKEWQQLQAAAKKEGKVVFGIFPSPELRQALDAAFKPRFGFDIELNLATSAKTVKRIVDENAAGVRFFDVIISTWDNLDHTLLPQGLVEPLASSWILPEVKDPKNWWGGHLWTDKAKRFAYAPMGYMQDNIWYNSTLVKPEEVTHYDHLLNPKWKGKIALWDPREGGAAAGKWSFLWATKGEEYLKNLVQQISFVSNDRRLVADALARGKVALTIGPTYYSFAQFMKSGLPVKPLPPSKEGTYVSVGNGGPVILKNAAHPNAARLLVNWLLSREGQELYTKAAGQATRRLDVDTKWMADIGVRAVKDFLTLEDYNKWENQSEDKILSLRRPAQEFARKILP
jgi:iron(III) transport system substrate-binding protein